MEQTVVEYYRNKKKYEARDRILKIVIGALAVSALVAVFFLFIYKSDIQRYTEAYEKTVATDYQEYEYALTEETTWSNYSDYIRSTPLDVVISIDRPNDYLNVRYSSVGNNIYDYNVARWGNRYLFSLNTTDEADHNYLSYNRPQIYDEAEQLYMDNKPLFPSPEYILDGTLEFDSTNYGSFELATGFFTDRQWEEMAHAVFGDKEIDWTANAYCYFEIEDGVISYYHYICNFDTDENEYGTYNTSFYVYDYSVYKSSYTWDYAQEVDDLDATASELFSQYINE